jgi:protein TonB
MRTIDPTLVKALSLGLSILLHALVLAAGGRLHDPGRDAAAAHAAQLEITLQPPDALARLQPPLFLNESAQPAAQTPKQIRSEHEASAQAAHAPHTAVVLDSGSVLAGEAARQANAQMAQELLYPPEAIARGLEGQALVLLFLDASGNAIAARLEASSGHALLDAAAVRAARTLHSLPDSAPREALLPVRFRLR